jgi:hypothetical protein
LPEPSSSTPCGATVALALPGNSSTFERIVIHTGVPGWPNVLAASATPRVPDAVDAGQCSAMNALQPYDAAELSGSEPVAPSILTSGRLALTTIGGGWNGPSPTCGGGDVALTFPPQALAAIASTPHRALIVRVIRSQPNDDDPHPR